MFPILWTLDPLSLGFNFCPPLPHPSQKRLSPPCFLPLVIRSRPADFIQARCTRATMLAASPCPRLWNEVVHNATAIRSRAPASGWSLLSQLFPLLSSSFLLFFSFFYSVPIERGSSIRTDSFRPLSPLRRSQPNLT